MKSVKKRIHREKERYNKNPYIYRIFGTFETGTGMRVTHKCSEKWIITCFQQSVQLKWDKQTQKKQATKKALKFKFKVNDCKQFQKVMARLSRKQQQDKRELLSSLNHMNNCNSKHAAENRKFVFLSQDYSFDSMFSKENNLPGNLRYFIGQTWRLEAF